MPSDLTIRPSWGTRLAGIEGLRAVAALTVIAGHVRLHLHSDVNMGIAARTLAVIGDTNGLTLFFVLSGFLLFRPFASSIVGGTATPSISRFLRNRALRVYPAYIVIFLLASYVLRTTYQVGASDELGVANSVSTLGPITEPFKLLANLTMFQTLWPSTLRTGLGVAWSLTTELTFYLLLPLLALGAAWLARRRVSPLIAALTVPATLLAMGLAGRTLGYATLHDSTENERFAQLWGATWHAVLMRSILAQGDLFGWGCLAAVAFSAAELHKLTGNRLVVLRATGLAAFIFVFGLLLVANLPGPLRDIRLEPSVVAAALGGLVLVVTLPRRSGRASPLGRALDLAPIRNIGVVSYSVYLWHLPVMWWLEERGWLLGPSRVGYAVDFLIVIAATLVLSTITYHFVEKPALRLKKRTDWAAPAGTSHEESPKHRQAPLSQAEHSSGRPDAASSYLDRM